MKIGITEGSYNVYPKEGRYQRIKADGYDCVDFGMSNTEVVPYTLGEEEFDAYLLHERALAEEAGITISRVHGPWRWPPQDTTEEDRAERMEKMKRSIRGTALLGCKNWIVHPIMPFGINDLDTGEVEQTWDLNVSFMRQLLACAKEHGVYICLENMPMPRFSLGSVEAIMRLVREMNDDSFRVCLDTGHVNVFEGATLYDAVHTIGDKLRHVHFADSNRWFPGYGHIDFEGVYQMLKARGYSDYCSFECNNLPSVEAVRTNAGPFIQRLRSL